MKDDEKTVFLAGAFVVVFVVLTFLLNVWTLACLWKWFAVPLGAPEIGLAHAFGLMLLSWFFQKEAIYNSAIAASTSNGKEHYVMVASTFGSLMLLGMGFVCQFYV